MTLPTRWRAGKKDREEKTGFGTNGGEIRKEN
jgi:hypothetical protein